MTMDRRENIDDLFRDAAEKNNPENFPKMENVWAKIEGKLGDQKVRNQKRTWKKIAVAASILLCGSIGYQVFEKESKVINSEETIIVHPENIQIPSPQKVASDEIENSTSSDENQTVNAPIPPREISPKPLYSTSVEKDEVIADSDQKEKAETSYFSSAPAVIKIDSNAVAYEEVQKWSDKKSKEKSAVRPSENNKMISQGYSADGLIIAQDAKKQITEEPLYVIDKKAITAKTDDEYDRKKERAYNISELDSVTYLREPLYIINGKEFSENELFGSNPTSPYAPLHKQDIEIIKIYKEVEAVKIFGKKGKKGVVVITTKFGKPAVINQK